MIGKEDDWNDNFIHREKGKEKDLTKYFTYTIFLTKKERKLQC